MLTLMAHKGRCTMQTTLTIDDELLARARALAEPDIAPSDLLRECVEAFIQLQAARRLATLGGQMPEVELAPRRRDEMPAS